ncbi:hypothetical protein DFR30_0457 [Thiogranum longum]|uniref:Uncharacterized protein n=1 Tax=Thiogranum longum TaxID=1537524 RepID=A0A4R1HAN6_9GAMM|nr:hypothetical protein [Thiogranum longum]TCK17235.1 hypothetical protein DFR30_0457 [Thiogranum longum]
MVEEDAYRSTYNAVNQRRCAFEKAVLTRRCHCSCSTRFYLADREGISCNAAQAHSRCQQLLLLMRENARFALKLTGTGDELPHAKEIKVQNGGLLGLQNLLLPDAPADAVVDIATLTVQGVRTFGSIQQFPFQEIVKSIVHFEGRRRPHAR